MHIALLGDSIFDNTAYTMGGPDVISHLRTMLPDAWRATLCGVDGTTTATFPRQLADVPADATHLVIALGGNDALQAMPLLADPVSFVGEGLAVMGAQVARFEDAYRQCIALAIGLRLPTTLCTIYDGHVEPGFKAVARTGVALFNDVILRVARERGLPVIELRHVCTEPEDYVLEVEPSAAGGRKVAAAVLEAVSRTDPAGHRTLHQTGRMQRRRGDRREGWSGGPSAPTN